MQAISVTEQTAGGRIDKYLIRYLDKAPRGFVYKMIRKKNIVLNDKKCQGNEILAAGDVIKLYLADETVIRFRTENAGVGEKRADVKQNTKDSLKKYIIYEDDNIIAMNKPAGMLSQRADRGDISLNDLLSGYLVQDEMFTPGISNRLDRNTSGIVLAGKNPGAVRSLNRAVKERKLSKLYLCAVGGKVAEKTEIEGYLVKNEAENTVRIFGAESKESPEDASYIKTVYAPVSANERISILEVDLITGRSHQIRAHLASVGHPIVGDVKYGSSVLNDEFRSRYRISRQMLHAYKIRFENMDGILGYLNGREITCPLPDDFIKILKGEKLCLHGSQGDSEVPSLKR